MSVYQIYLLQCDEFRCQTPDVRSLARSLGTNLVWSYPDASAARCETALRQYNGIHTRAYIRVARAVHASAPCRATGSPFPLFSRGCVNMHFGRVCARDRDERGSISVRRFYVTFWYKNDGRTGTYGVYYTMRNVQREKLLTETSQIPILKSVAHRPKWILNSE